MDPWETLNRPQWLYHIRPSHRDRIPAFLLKFFKITKEHPGRSFFCPYLHRFPIHNHLNIPQDTYHEFLRISTTVRTIILLRQVLQISFPLLNHKYTKNSRYTSSMESYESSSSSTSIRSSSYFCSSWISLILSKGFISLICSGRSSLLRHLMRIEKIFSGAWTSFPLLACEGL